MGEGAGLGVERVDPLQGLKAGKVGIVGIEDRPVLDRVDGERSIGGDRSAALAGCHQFDHFFGVVFFWEENTGLRAFEPALDDGLSRR